MKYLNRKHIELARLYAYRYNPFMKWREEGSFVVSGMPRSGTMFVAKLLNKYTYYKVTHDLHVKLGHKYVDTQSEKYLQRLNYYFQTKNYGDVSGVHRAYIDKLEVEKKLLLIRNPHDILESYLNMGERNYKQTVMRLEDGRFVKDFYALIDKIEDENIPYIKFEQFTSNAKEFERLANILGIGQIDLGHVNFEKKVNSRDKEYKLSDLSGSLFQKFDDSITEYRKYFGY